MDFTIKTIIISIIFNLNMFGQSTEIQPYTLIKKIDSIEIRFYPIAKIVKTSSENGNNNFGKLFQYISGKNDKNKKIAMTAPVYMDEKGKEMAFVLPSLYNDIEVPESTRDDVTTHTTKPMYVASLTYGGYSNSEKVKKHKNTLINTLKKSEIATIGKLKILGYDAPFKFYNRRNEVMIEINYNNWLFIQSSH